MLPDNFDSFNLIIDGVDNYQEQLKYDGTYNLGLSNDNLTFLKGKIRC